MDERLLNPNQSGFRLFDSYKNKFLPIGHEILEPFYCNPQLECRALLLDILKAFDKIWHQGLLYKLKCMGISGNLYSLHEN